jgi:hypothetical protein
VLILTLRNTKTHPNRCLGVLTNRLEEDDMRLIRTGAAFIWLSVAVAHSLSQLARIHDPVQVSHFGAAERGKLNGRNR